MRVYLTRGKLDYMWTIYTFIYSRFIIKNVITILG